MEKKIIEYPPCPVVMWHDDAVKLWIIIPLCIFACLCGTQGIILGIGFITIWTFIKHQSAIKYWNEVLKQGNAGIMYKESYLNKYGFFSVPNEGTFSIYENKFVKVRTKRTEETEAEIKEIEDRLALYDKYDKACKSNMNYFMSHTSEKKQDAYIEYMKKHLWKDMRRLDVLKKERLPYTYDIYTWQDYIKKFYNVDVEIIKEANKKRRK